MAFTSLPCALKLLTHLIHGGWIVRMKTAEDVQEIVEDAKHNDVIIQATGEEAIEDDDLHELYYIK